MRAVPRVLLWLLMLAQAWIEAGEPLRYRHWLAGREIGGAEYLTTTLPDGAKIGSRMWAKITNGATTVALDQRSTAIRRADGSISIAWSSSIGATAKAGKASWSPARPGVLRVETKGGKARDLAVPQGAIIWGQDLKDRYMEAARTSSPIRLTEYSAPAEDWGQTEMECLGPDPLPGFPDAVKFKGNSKVGSSAGEMEFWISPTEGTLRWVLPLEAGSFLGQRAEMPAPEAPAGGAFPADALPVRSSGKSGGAEDY
jgi:hypothetical protein